MQTGRVREVHWLRLLGHLTNNLPATFAASACLGDVIKTRLFKPEIFGAMGAAHAVNSEDNVGEAKPNSGDSEKQPEHDCGGKA